MANAPSVLLESLLDSASDEELDQRLRLHGPIKDSELPTLIEKARSANGRTRRNATALLLLSRSPEAEAALEQIAVHTSDAVQYAVALGGLLDNPRLASLVRPELLSSALSSDDPEVLANALSVAAKTKQPGIDAAIEKALSNPSTKVRQAALRAARDSNPARFEQQLAAELLKEDSALSLRELYQTLSHSDDSKMAEVFAQSLKLGPSHRSTDFHNGIYFEAERKPWLRTLLLDLLKQGGELSESAFHILEKWGDSDKVLCAICIESLEKAPPVTDPSYRSYMIEREQCRAFLGKLAGHAPFTWEQRDAALAFAREWMQKEKRTP